MYNSVTLIISTVSATIGAQDPAFRQILALPLHSHVRPGLPIWKLRIPGTASVVIMEPLLCDVITHVLCGLRRVPGSLWTQLLTSTRQSRD